jgi:Putative Ig domain/PEP-CTERM motif
LRPSNDSTKKIIHSVKVMRLIKILVSVLGLFFAITDSHAATIIQNLGGLLTPTGAATNGNTQRQYSWTTSGGEVTVVYTVTTSAALMNNSYTDGSIFRNANNSNIGSGNSITLTLNSISANSGWTLNSTTMADNVTVAINAGDTSRFSVNGGATFDYLGTGSGVTQQVVTDSRFSAFDAVGDTLTFINFNQTTNGGQNLRNLQFTFDVVAIPEPSSLALFGVAGAGFCFWRRRIKRYSHTHALKKSHHTFSVLFFLLGVLGCSSSYGAVDYYVSALIGSDQNSGLSPSTPFKTLGKGRDMVSAGGTVHIMNGTYRNSNYGNGRTSNNGTAFNINKSGNSSAGYITFKNYDGHTPKIEFDGASGISVASGMGYLVIEGLEIRGPAASISYESAYAKRQELAGVGPATGDSANYYTGRGIVGWGPHSHVVIRRCKVYDTSSSGIRFNKSDHMIVEDSIVGRTCWWTSLAESAVVFAETVADAGDNSTATKMIFRRNLIHDNWNRIPFYTANLPPNSNPPFPDYGTASQDYILDGQGLYVTRSDPAYTGTFLMENNVCINNGKNGINFDHSTNAKCIIRHNTMYHNGSHNFIQNEHDGPNRVAGITSSNIGSVTITNNIIVVRPPAKETTQISCRADSQGDLNNTYFDLEGPTGTHRFWYSVNGSGTAPSNPGGGLHLITISTNATGTTVATATQNVIDPLNDFVATVTNNMVTVTDVALADRKNVKDYGTAHTFAVTQQGMGSNEYHGITIWDNSLRTCNYNLIRNGSYGGTLSAGANDLSADPLFINPSADLAIADFNLASGSPAINTASTSPEHASLEDFMQVVRPLGATPDLGAFESSNLPPENQAPTWVTNPFTRPDGSLGQAYSRFINFNASDADGDALTYAISSGPSWLIMSDINTGKITGTPLSENIGLNVFTVTVTDGINAPASAYMLIEVVNPADVTPPTLINIVDNQSGSAISIDEFVTYTVSFSKDIRNTTVQGIDFSNAGTASISITSIEELAPGIFTMLVTPTSTGSLQLQISQGAEILDPSGNALNTATGIPDNTIIQVYGVGETYDSWITMNGISGDNVSITADSDQDGISQLLEFAFGTNPNQSDPQTLVVQNSNNFSPGLPETLPILSSSNEMRIRFVRRKNHNEIGLSYTPMFSSNLENFQPDPEPDAPTVVSDAGGGYEVVEVAYPITDSQGQRHPKMFTVIRITHAP